jgi:8-amino-7-oxononanoate synthase
VTIQGRTLLMLGSNNYLGLTTHPKLKEAAAAAVKKYGTGCTGSRFLNGTLDLHLELEQKLCQFTGKEDCLVFSTGYQANLGSVSALVGRNDYAVTDKLDHGSIVDGCKLSYGHTKRYVHNDMDNLDRALAAVPEDCGSLVIADGVFSMDGDIVKLPELARIAKRHGARIMIDDAHAMGVLGKTGAGTCEHFGLESEVDLVVGTFSKSFATLGGFAVGDKEVITFIRHNSRPQIFSASLPPPVVATAITALEMIMAEPERRERLWRNTRRMLRELKAMGYDTGTAETPIIPLILGDLTRTINFWHDLFEAGVFANPVIPPAVPPNACLIRTSYMATHTDEDLDMGLELLERVGRKSGVIP